MAELIGFVGLGRMGGPMAKNLARNQMSLLLYDVSDERMEDVASVGGRKTGSVAELAAEALDAEDRLGAEGQKTVALDQSAVGRLSRMDAMQGQAMAAAVEARRGQRRAALTSALRRLDNSEFGWCADCGEFIGQGRLDVDPVLQLCVGCAGRG